MVPAEYDEATFGENPIGTGPYKLKEAVEGEEREALLKQLYDDMVRDTLIIGLYSETKVIAANAKLSGLILSQIGAYEYQNEVITED